MARVLPPFVPAMSHQRRCSTESFRASTGISLGLGSKICGSFSTTKVLSVIWRKIRYKFGKRLNLWKVATCLEKWEKSEIVATGTDSDSTYCCRGLSRKRVVKQRSCGCLEEGNLGCGSVRNPQCGIRMVSGGPEDSRADKQQPCFLGVMWRRGFSSGRRGLPVSIGNDEISPGQDP